MCWFARLVRRVAFRRIIDHLLETDILRLLDGLLVFGVEGERVFGPKNFFDLYSVFETPAEVVVKTLEDGRVVGTLETDFVRKMESSTFTFLLAGRTWRMADVDLDDALVVAIPFTGGESPRWHGAGGFLNIEVTEEMRDILLGDEDYRFVDEAGRDGIEKVRAACRPLLERDRCSITREGNMLRLRTCAGGRVNATIAVLLETRGAARASSIGDLEVELEISLGGTLSEQLVRSELLRLREVDASLTDTEMAGLVSGKDRGRLAKFQQYLPQDLEGSYLAKELFDFVTTAKLTRNSTFPIVRG